MVDGIPILVRDHAALEQEFEKQRRSGRGAWYDDSQGEQHRGPYRHHLQKRAVYVAQVLSERRRQGAPLATILDLGCGDGEHLPWLSTFATACYGSDYNLGRLLRAAQRAPGAHLFLADVTAYPIADEVFDVIFFNHVLEHIPDDVRALAEVYRILKPGGLVILGTPNEGALFWRIAYVFQPRARATSDHRHFYTANTLVERCRSVGFSVQDIHRIGWGIPHWTLDAKLRQFRWIDDCLAWLGSRWLPSQATSLYLVLSK